MLTAAVGFVLSISLLRSQDQAASAERVNAGENCTFQADPDAYLAREAAIRTEVFENVKRFRAAGLAPTPASSIPRRNFIDDEVLTPLQNKNIPVAALSDDYEFSRRIYLDFAGRIPSVDEVRAFAADKNPNKRGELINRLAYGPGFTDRWMQFFGEWLGLTISNSNISVNPEGRNAFYFAVRSRLAANQPLDRMAWDILASGGNNFMNEQGLANWIAMGRMTGGPVQDQWDAMFARSASTFLGQGHYDCLLCHSGRGHLDLVSLWGTGTTRMQAWQMAAFFSKTDVHTATSVANANQWVITERSTGPYGINTTFGNRPNRSPVTQADGTQLRAVNPQFKGGPVVAPSVYSWRGVFASNVIRDRMFARNLANRLWKEMFGQGLVEPVDTLDPARLDPKKPPTDGTWQLQASHPVLLEMLADRLIATGFDLREFVSFMAASSTYQLSSRYAGDWNVGLANTYARHYPRRLSAEELYDAISAATGTADLNKLFVRTYADPLKYAIQLPDPSEPGGTGTGSTNGTFTSFANPFIRGNRDNTPASRGGSVLMQLTIMNNGYVTGRTKLNASPRLRTIRDMVDDTAMIQELYLTYLGRPASDTEIADGKQTLKDAPNRNSGIEDLAWVMVNKLEFIYSH